MIITTVNFDGMPFHYCRRGLVPVGDVLHQLLCQRIPSEAVELG